MNEVIREIERAVKTLNEADVRYLIVGGVAVVLHGYLRTTSDLDLVVRLDPENASRAMEALDAAGYRPRAPVALSDFADPEKRAQWIREKGMVVFTVVHPDDRGLEIDLFVTEPFDFEEAWERSVPAPVLSQPVRVVGRSDLIRIKRASGRPIDLADVEALESLEDPEPPR